MCHVASILILCLFLNQVENQQFKEKNDIPIGEYDWVVVVSVSEWYEDIFHNWLLWYNRLDLELKTIVIAEDNVIYQKYANCTDFTTLHFEMEKVSTYLILLTFKVLNSSPSNHRLKIAKEQT